MDLSDFHNKRINCEFIMKISRRAGGEIGSVVLSKITVILLFGSRRQRRKSETCVNNRQVFAT